VGLLARSLASNRPGSITLPGHATLGIFALHPCRNYAACRIGDYPWRGGGPGNKWDGLYLARQKGKELVYAGKVDHDFDTASAKDLQARLKPLIRKTQPYSKKIAHRGVWVEPSLLAEIEYRAKSAEGKVRHPFFKGIREDL
jgi:ATP-dependent DNA ligase